MLAQLEVLGGRDPELVEAERGELAREVDQLLRLLVVERLEHDAVDDAEDRAVGADAQRDGDDGDDRVSRRAAELPQTVPEVLHDGLEQDAAALVAHRVLELLDAARLQPREATRLGRVDARRDLLLRQELDVRAQLLVEIALDLLARDQIVPEAPKAIEQRHGRLSSRGARRARQVAWSARVMASDTRFHSLTSASSCRRPAAVSR